MCAADNTLFLPIFRSIGIFIISMINIFVIFMMMMMNQLLSIIIDNYLVFDLEMISSQIEINMRFFLYDSICKFIAPDSLIFFPHNK